MNEDKMFNLAHAVHGAMEFGADEGALSLIRAALADIWDEGYDTGIQTPTHSDGFELYGRPANPYKEEA